MWAAANPDATAELAQGVCGADEVVYVDLDHGRYYKKGTEAFGKSDPTSVAEQKQCVLAGLTKAKLA